MLTNEDMKNIIKRTNSIIMLLTKIIGYFAQSTNFYADIIAL